MMPPHSFIDPRDFKDAGELAHYLLFLARNEALYNTYLEWKAKPMPEGFRRAKALDWDSFACRVCAWVDERTKSKGWFG
jgi:hypothetical protein